MLLYLVFAGVAVQALGFLYYIRETLYGQTKPNRVSWVIWAIAPLVAAFAALASGAGWAALPVFAVGLGPLVVLLATFKNKRSYWKLGALDYVCGVLSILALVLWAATKDPLAAIMLAIASDTLACVPTVVKAWSHPETESGVPYLAGLFNSFTSFAAINSWNFASYGFPVYLALANSALIFSVYRRKIIR